MTSSFDRLVESQLVDKVYLFEELASTNTEAVRWLKEKRALPERLLLIARRQDQGRGQFQRVWWSSERSLTFSIILPWRRLPYERDASAQLSIHVAKAVLLAIRHYLNAAGVDATPLRVKPPNDVYFGPKKLAGILIESPCPQSVVLGIGVNLNNRQEEYPPALTDCITSVYDLTQCEVTPVDFLQILLQDLLPSRLLAGREPATPKKEQPTRVTSEGEAY
ncbi:MAG: biotin--[acetyl-CoA-carboxylase] ligase [Planctomycetia bacterium]|nr:biotin--[acetyl-CoA-carboxylase] ligase [Planctomycetia bacterium]